MKFTTLLAVLVPLALAQEPTLAGRAPEIEKRAIQSATVMVDGLRYRNCPKRTCDAPGQYPKGTKIKLSCYTRDGTTTENGDKGWAKVYGGVGNGKWVALGFRKYVDWESKLSL